MARQLAGKACRALAPSISASSKARKAFLAFESGELDVLLRAGREFTRIVAPGGKLGAAYVKRGVRYFREPEADLTYLQFNMDNPVAGRLRAGRLPAPRDSDVAEPGQGNFGDRQQPGAGGTVADCARHHRLRPGFKNVLGSYSPARANALLDRFGYRIATATAGASCRTASRY